MQLVNHDELVCYDANVLVEIEKEMQTIRMRLHH